jgi:putative hemolysin
MINVEQAVNSKFPGFATQPELLRKPAISLLKYLLHETEINNFLTANHDTQGIEWIERVFDYLNFSYRVSARDWANIPASGRVLVYANHPIGSLDGLALLSMVSGVRRDVMIVANDLLSQIGPIRDLIIPVDNLGEKYGLASLRRIIRELEQEKAVIIFPAGEVSRASPVGVRDVEWLPGFLLFARKTGAPLLPVQVEAKNSLLFYSASMLFKPLSTALLSSEMFKHQSDTINLHVGEAIPAAQLKSDKIHDRTLIQRLRKHLYKLGRKQSVSFKTEKTIAHPEDRRALIDELAQAEKLGETRDGHSIFLVSCDHRSALLREIGRQREVAFRKVGEGTGQRRDLDSYDPHYRHLVLWDNKRLEIAGAYRLALGSEIFRHQGEAGFYTHSLYDFAPEFHTFLHYGVELGRSFVNPAYWGKNSLDYLWQGIGAFLARHPSVRYLIGPVSMSGSFPRSLMDELVFYFQRYYQSPLKLVNAKTPYLISPMNEQQMLHKYADKDRDTAFAMMQHSFHEAEHKIPVLYKQYTALFETGGFQLLVFSVDRNFSDCLDGLFMADLTYLKASKRQRYITAS